MSHNKLPETTDTIHSIHSIQIFLGNGREVLSATKNPDGLFYYYIYAEKKNGNVDLLNIQRIIDEISMKYKTACLKVTCA